jgi:hypothetical protein
MSELKKKRKQEEEDTLRLGENSEEYVFPFANEDYLGLGPIGIIPPPISRQKIDEWRPGDCLKIFNRPNDTDEAVDRRVGILNVLTLNKHDVVRFVDYFPYTGESDISWAIIEDNNNQYALPSSWLDKINQSECPQNTRTTVRAKKTKVSKKQLVYPDLNDAAPPENAAATYNAKQISNFQAYTRPSGKIGENCIVIKTDNIEAIVPEIEFIRWGISVEPQKPRAKNSSVHIAIETKVTILNVLNIRSLVVVRTTTYPIMIFVIPLADITLSKAGKFSESFLPQKAVRDFIAQTPRIPQCIENNFSFFSDTSRKLATYYVTQILGDDLENLPKIAFDDKYFKYDNTCFIKYGLFGSKPSDKMIHIDTFKCFSLPYGSILFFECLLNFFIQKYTKVELIAQPFSTREHLTREEEFDLQSSLIKYYCNIGLNIKNPKVDDNDKFDNVFIQDIETVMKMIIYNIMMMDCEKFNTYFRYYDGFIPCDYNPAAARTVLKAAVNPVLKAVNPVLKAAKVQIGQSLRNSAVAVEAEKGGSKRRTKKRKSKKRIRRKSIKKKRMGRTKKRRKSIKKRK